MKNRYGLICSVVVLAGGIFFLTAQPAVSSPDTSGEALFKANCAVCHPGGGNVVNPAKTLHKKDRDANNVKTVSDIIGKMRKPGPGMTQFDQKTVSDKDAKEIADYIIKTFNK
jgi:cytochrome c6